MIPKYAVKSEPFFSIPDPYGWLAIGLMLIMLGSVLPWGVYHGLETSPWGIGIIMAGLFPALILGNHIRPQSKRNKQLLALVCVVFLTHGLWWEWYWMSFSLRVDVAIVWFIPDWKQWEGIDPIVPPAVFGGLMFLTALLTVPIWKLTRSRNMMLVCFAAATLPGAVHVRWGGGWNYNFFVSFFQDPVNLWYLMILFPLARAASHSQLKFVEDRCHFCDYSLEGLPDLSICPECGKYPFYKRKSDPQAALENLVDSD